LPRREGRKSTRRKRRRRKRPSKLLFVRFESRPGAPPMRIETGSRSTRRRSNATRQPESGVIHGSERARRETSDLRSKQSSGRGSANKNARNELVQQSPRNKNRGKITLAPLVFAPPSVECSGSSEEIDGRVEQTFAMMNVLAGSRGRLSMAETNRARNCQGRRLQRRLWLYSATIGEAERSYRRN
jgi:hypothetical protein